MAGLNIFITGASGFIGSYVLEKIILRLDKDDKIFILSRFKFDPKDERIIVLEGDLSGIEKFRREILVSDYFFHLAANATFGNNVDYDQINFKPTKEIVNILKESGRLKNFIFTSTIGAVDRHKDDICDMAITTHSMSSPTSNYGKSKLKAEEFVRQSKIPFTIFRPTWVYGKNMRADSHLNKFVSMAYTDSFLFKFNFPGKVSLIHADDLAMALVKCINNNNVLNKIYLAETESLSIGEILKIIYERTKGKFIKQINIPKLNFIGKFHSKIPLTLSNLFIDYLYANDNDFKRDFEIIEFKKLVKTVDDIISTNIINSGYWIITGANSGIGFALASRLRQKGKKLILIDKEAHNLRGFSDILLEADLANSDNINQIALEVNKYKIYRLINNAGVGYKKDFIGMNNDEISATININIIAPVFLTKLLIGNLIKNKGTIVNIASSAAFNPLPGMSLYAASKSFILNWSHSLWYEMRGKCDIITFSPSGTKTGFQKKAGVISTDDLLSPEYVAGQIIKAIEEKDSFVLLGLKNKIIFQIVKFLPTKFNIIFFGEAFKKLR